ncbi:uncharacterized protein FOBCDRAFT_146739 [Fusarium oxysporum Fo47]|uniref:uncharacterized protein n=1 Tax=Fusarium oxysporum Fo47 TaxID=660027 RepID=UPI002869E932|nr:uncharacterized protein FOBCDRAFT_146739 [Fusarium oxysporum Fo47]WJG37059.1 hypothetical protein FOBCDRAFT_146739 [Fusarium oxysporum Fo47]
MPTENDTVRKYVQYLGFFNPITSLKKAVNVTSISGLTWKYRSAAERLHSSTRLCLGAFTKRSYMNMHEYLNVHDKRTG